MNRQEQEPGEQDPFWSIDEMLSEGTFYGEKYTVRMKGHTKQEPSHERREIVPNVDAAALELEEGRRAEGPRVVRRDHGIVAVLHGLRVDRRRAARRRPAAEPVVVEREIHVVLRGEPRRRLEERLERPAGVGRQRRIDLERLIEHVS